MPKTLLGIIASPRKNGNCELFTKSIYLQLEGHWELRLMRLPELDIRPCKACYRCLFDGMRCPQADDFLTSLEELAGADAVVVSAPAYLLAANAGLKKFLDRGLQFYSFVDQLWGKPAVAVAVAGIEGMEGSTKLDVERFVKLTMGDLRGSAVVYGALPGETLLSARNRNTASLLAQNLSGTLRQEKADNPACPLCGSDTFRFLPGGRIRCMQCSSAGRYEWSQYGLKIEAVPGRHPLFFSKEDALRHAEWLRGMKGRFLERRGELKEVAKEFKVQVNWVGKKA
ncbi:MAG: flavodoxin family protein [Syntrophobacteraceae bacterium]